MGQEKLFENKIKKFLSENGCYFIKHFANSYTKSGIPDIIASVNGHFVAIEVKAANGKPSKLQLHNISEIEGSGGIAVLLYPDDFEHFKEMIGYLLNDQVVCAWDIADDINKKHGLQL